MSIRDFLLNKAVRDLSRLVKVKRLRQTKNGVVPAYVWVRPSQILKTDVIVQNAHNAVSLGNGLYAPAKGVWDRRYFASLAKTDKKKAMEYAQSLGITWVRDSNAGKDWIRAFKAVKDYSKPHTKIQTPTAPQATIQPTPTPKVTKPKAQTPTAKQPEPKVDESLLEIDPTKMSQREQNIANLLNKCTDAEALKIFAKAGIVGEDDQATEFVKEKLYKGYYGGHLKDDAFNIPHSFILRGHNTTQQASLEYHLDTIGTKLGLAKKDVLTPYLRTLATGGTYNSEDSDFGKIIDPLQFGRSLRYAHGDLGEAFLNLQRNGTIFDHGGLSNALKHIVKEQPELKASADYLESEYTKLTSMGIDDTSLEELLKSDPSFTLEQHTHLDKTYQGSYENEFDKLVDTLKNENIDINDFADKLIANDLDEDTPYIRDQTFYDIVFQGTHFYGNSKNLKVLALKSGKSIRELIKLPKSELDTLMNTVFAPLSKTRKAEVCSSISEKVAFLAKDYAITEFVNSPKFNEAVELSLNLKGCDICSASNNVIGSPVNDLKMFSPIDLLEILHTGYVTIHNSDGTSDDYVINVKSDLSKEMKTTYSNIMYSSHVISALTNVEGECLYNGKDKNTVLSYIRDNSDIFDRIPTISIKDRDAIINKATSLASTSIARPVPDDDAIRNTLNGMGLLTTARVSDLEPEVAKLFRDSVQMLASYSIKLNAKKTCDTPDKRVAYVDKILGYNQKPKPQTEIDPSELKELRERALSKCNCTLKTADQATYDSMDHKIKQDWDKGKLDTSGDHLYGYISFVNHGVYHINNSVAEDRFNTAVKALDQKGDYNTPNTTSANKKYFEKDVRSLYHGTNFRGGCGILGVDGKFRDYREAQDIGQKTAGTLLGHGVYLADLAGKSAGYLSQWGQNYGRGALLVCDAVLGNHHESNDYDDVDNDYNSDSVSIKKGTQLGGGRTLRADEWCVRDQSLVFPRMIIDAEAVRR